MPTRKILWAAYAAAAISTATAGAGTGFASPKPKFDDGSSLSEVVDQIRMAPFRSERMTLPVSIGTGPPLTFLIDTGAELSGITPDVARRYSLEHSGFKTVVGIAGRKDVPMVVLPNLRFARNDGADVEALLFSRGDLGADGFLGINSLSDQRIEFNFEKSTMKLSRAPKLGLQSSARSVVVQAKGREGRLVFSTAHVNGVGVSVMLDTGSMITIGNAALMRALVAKQRLGETIPVKILSVTGEMVGAEYGVLREVTIGDVKIRRLPIAFATVEPFHHLGWDDRPALLLGMDALRVFSAVTVDFRSKMVKFVARDYDPHDASVRLWGNW